MAAAESGIALFRASRERLERRPGQKEARWMQLTIGAIRFDLSIMVLLLVAFIGMQLAFGAAA